MADLPNTPIAVVPAESPGDPDYPSLGGITVADLVGPLAANRQPNQLGTRTNTLRDRINKIIADLTFIETGGPSSSNAFLPRDGGQAMAASLDFGTNRGINLIDPTAAQDAATKNYVDVNATVGIQGYRGEIKVMTERAVGGTRLEAEFCRVLDSTNAKMMAPAANTIIDASAVNGLLALDVGGSIVGAAANWYYLYAVADPTGANPDSYIVSLDAGPAFGGVGPSFVNVTPPSVYSLYRRVASMRWDGTKFLNFRKIDRETYYDSTQNVTSGAAPLGTPALLSLAAFVPPTAERAMLRARMQTTITPASLWFYDGGQVGGGAGSVTTTILHTGTAFYSPGHDDFALHVDAAQSIYWWGSAGVNVGVVDVRGYVDDSKEG